MIAADLMTRDVVTIDASSSLSQAAAVMSEHNIRHLPVLGDDEHLAGILSDHDMREFNLSRVADMESLERLQARLSVSVSMIMSADVITVEPETEVSEIVELMVEEKIGAVPVVDPETDTLVGMISYVDVLRAAREALKEYRPAAARS
jgi:acetoin utilization protein AcuB